MKKRKKALMPKVQLHSKRYQRDKDGNIIVNMTVKNDDDFLSVYSTNEIPVIATDVAEFIENNTSSLHASDPLTLRIYSNCIDESEQKDYREAIKEYYTDRSDDHFVPVKMTYENYKACAAPKRLLIVPGAEHGLSYCVDKEQYEATVYRFWREFDKPFE